MPLQPCRMRRLPVKDAGEAPPWMPSKTTRRCSWQNNEPRGVHVRDVGMLHRKSCRKLIEKPLSTSGKCRPGKSAPHRMEETLWWGREGKDVENPANHATSPLQCNYKSGGMSHYYPGCRAAQSYFVYNTNTSHCNYSIYLPLPIPPPRPTYNPTLTHTHTHAVSCHCLRPHAEALIHQDWTAGRFYRQTLLIACPPLSAPLPSLIHKARGADDVTARTRPSGFTGASNLHPCCIRSQLSCQPNTKKKKKKILCREHSRRRNGKQKGEKMKFPDSHEVPRLLNTARTTSHCVREESH